MMLLHEFLQQYVLLEDTHGLFEYRQFALRLETRFGKRVLRKDYTPEEIQDVAQNTLDVNLLFFMEMSNQVLSPFKTWGEKGSNTLGTGFTDTTTPNLTETVTPDLTDTTTPNLTDATKHTGTVTDEQEGDSTQDNFVNAYNAATNSSPKDNSKSHATGNNITTYDNVDTTTHNGSTTVTHGGKTTKVQNGTNKVEHQNNGTDEYAKTGWNVSDYEQTMKAYYSFIDLVIDFIVRDILYLTIRHERSDKHG